MLGTGPPSGPRASDSQGAFHSGPLRELDLSLGSPGVSVPTGILKLPRKNQPPPPCRRTPSVPLRISPHLSSPARQPSPGPGPAARRPGSLALTAGRLWTRRPGTSLAPGGSGRGGTAERAERTAGARRCTGGFAPALLHRLPPPHTHTHTRAARAGPAPPRTQAREPKESLE